MSREAVKSAWTVFLTAAAFATGSPAVAQPHLTFERGGVVARGITAGDSVIWFAVTVEREGYFDTVRRPAALVVDDDGDGRVRFEPEGGAPDRSVWALVDLATGRFVVATPDRAPWFAEVAPPAELAGSLPATPVDRLRDARGYAEILLVRPGVGAWTASASDGGSADSTGANDGSLEVPLDRLEALGGTAQPPVELAPGDVVVVIDPIDRQYYAVRLGTAEAG